MDVFIRPDFLSLTLLNIYTDKPRTKSEVFIHMLVSAKQLIVDDATSNELLVA